MVTWVSAQGDYITWKTTRASDLEVILPCPSDGNDHLSGAIFGARWEDGAR
jgi:hypothetical protein